MFARRFRPLVASLLLAVPLAAQFGEVTGVVPIPAGIAGYGLASNGAGALLLTGAGAPDTITTMTPGGFVLFAFPAVLSGNPMGVTTDGATIYVTDTVGDDVDMYTPLGVPIGSFPVASAYPKGVTWNPATGTLFVVDSIGSAVLEYTVFGLFLGATPLLGASIDGIAADPAVGGFWVYDSGTDTVRHYSPGFVQFETFRGPVAQGHTAGEGVAVIGGTVYVVSTGSGVIVAYDVPDAMPPFSTASSSQLGTGCTTPAIVQEVFPPLGFDLAGGSLMFTPNGTGGYTVTPGAGPFVLPVAPPLPAGDDTIAPGLVLPFLFPHPGGSAFTIDVCSNGYVWLSRDRRADYTPTALEFESQIARIAALWMDLNPGVAGTVHYDAGPASAMVTWLGVAEYGVPASTNSAQLELFPGGSFALRWLLAGATAGSTLVGYSAGPETVGGLVNLSAAPFDTGAQTQPLGLARTTRAVLGTAMLQSVLRIPPGTALGFVVHGLVSFGPAGFPLGGMGMPGCAQYQTVDAVTPFLVFGPMALSGVLVPPAPAFAGLSIYSQAVTISPPYTLAGVLVSNGTINTIGF
jgi:hypothetical protein